MCRRGKVDMVLRGSCVDDDGNTRPRLQHAAPPQAAPPQADAEEAEGGHCVLLYTKDRGGEGGKGTPTSVSSTVRFKAVVSPCSVQATRWCVCVRVCGGGGEVVVVLVVVSCDCYCAGFPPQHATRRFNRLQHAGSWCRLPTAPHVTPAASPIPVP